jgi:Secretion system C-terminal sorting domain
MKHTLTFTLLLMGMALFAQPVFEHTFSESASYARLENLGEVYYSMDIINKQCLIYNMDHSLLKTISLPTPDGYYLTDIQYVSENLFNQDDLLELVYIYSKYNTEFYYYTFETRVINENGSEVLSLPEGSGYSTVVETSGQGKKFLVYEYDYSVIPYLTKTHVYSLPEASTKSVSLSLTKLQGNAYPNPADKLINIPISLPEGAFSGTLDLMDMNGRKLMSFPVTAGTRNMVLSTSHLHSGTYLYQINTDTGKRAPEARKILIR